MSEEFNKETQPNERQDTTAAAEHTDSVHVTSAQAQQTDGQAQSAAGQPQQEIRQAQQTTGQPQQEIGQSQQTARQPQQGAGQGNRTAGTTYSWVNPKLQHHEAGNVNPQNKVNAPWGNAGQGENNWRTTTQQSNAQQNRTAGSMYQQNGQTQYRQQAPTGQYQNPTGQTQYRQQAPTGQYHNAAGQTRYQQPGTNGQYRQPGANGSYQYTTGNGQYQQAGGTARNSQMGNTAPHTAKPKAKKAGTGKRWGMVVAMALVFGLIAGSVTYGVNYIGNKIYPIQGAAESIAPDTKNGTPKNAVDSGRTSEPSTQQPNGQNTAPMTGGDSGQSSQGTAQATGNLTVEQIAANCMPSVVTISTMSVMEMQNFFGGTQQYTYEGAGTGIIVGENDTELLIATNNHVIEGASQVSVGFLDESVVGASIKGQAVSDDLAVIAVDLDSIPESTRSAIKVVTIGSSEDLALGQQVVAIGNALGYGQSVTSGYISALNRELQLTDGTNNFTSSNLIQTDAAINSGNSGGALLNMKGELIGINEAKSSSSSYGATVDNIGYAIPISKAMPILENLISMNDREPVATENLGYLGVSCANDEMTAEMAQTYSIPDGVIVLSVVEGGPCGVAGMQKGDVIVAINGVSIASFSELQNEMQYLAAGETISIKVQRVNGNAYETVDMDVTLISAEALNALDQ